MNPRAVPPIVVFAASFIAFIPALAADWVDWDDRGMILEEAGWRGLAPSNIAWMFSNMSMGHYQPVAWMTLAVDYSVWGLYAPGFHFTNILIHAMVAVLLYHLGAALLRAIRAQDESWARWVAAGAAVLWAVHPLRVESVAWVTERRDLVCGLFYVATLLLYVRMTSDPAHRTRWLCLSLVAFALSLLSKAWGMTLPAVLLAADIWVLRRFETDEERHRAMVEKIPFVALAVAAGYVAGLAQRSVGAALSLEAHPVHERAMQAAYGVCFYPVKTLLPVALSPMYLIDRQLRITDPWIIASIAAIVALTVALVVSRRRVPALLTSWIGYVAVVSPVLGFYQSGLQLVADRYSYVSTMMLFLPLVALAAAPRRRIVAVSIVVAAVTLGGLTWRQAGHWRSTTALWTHAVDVDPRNYFARVELAKCKVQAGRHREAIEHCDAAVAVAQRYVEAYACRGAARAASGDFAGAIDDHGRALDLNPRHSAARTGRALAKLGLRDLAGAREDLDEALRLNPMHLQARMVWARVLEEEGLVHEAAEDYAKVLELAPPNWPSRAGVRSHLMRLRLESPR